MARRKTQLFNLSFLDLITGALGAVIFLFIITPKGGTAAPDKHQVVMYMDTSEMKIFGNLHDSLQNKQIGDWAPSIHTRLYAGDDKVFLEIHDNGVGISQKHHKQIFTPFFTTKSPGPNLGLGLSICYDIVHLEHHGTIQVTSEPNVKTMFKVSLPRG